MIRRSAKLSRVRRSDNSTPRSRSIASGSKVRFPAVSRISIKDVSIRSSVVCGRSSLYTVWSKPVDALVSAPKDRPLRSRILTISPSGTLVEPLNAMCSMKWASPRSSSPSAAEPKSKPRRTEAESLGVVFLSTAYFMPLGSVP